MVEGVTELEAYKHLLEVAENILQSVDIDKGIILKYDALKKGIKAKIRVEREERISGEREVAGVYRMMLD